ncbi:PQQ-dependent sugar dehydrogenase [Hyphococcus flavus]|uniref:PQQ-dependent sugar dehydrogenase n=1 Tax=Hyphococcus flavus TaxID=1866326 RepID=A0AAF0CGI2_9PROT|nr:PQQ-dependent sugar dehydrogenase [Hyphococcus flavus]WDI30702.1 PQQ-dependent sugar dehydrogenase [Hyphococcus flavus]
MHNQVKFVAIAIGVLFAVSCAQQETNTNVETPSEIQPGFEMETLATGLALPWSMAFTPDGEILIIEKAGGVRVYRDGALDPNPVSGAPEGVYVRADSGRHDIALDPDFIENRRVFLAYAEGDEDANRLVVWRGVYENGAFTNGEVIFRATPDKEGAGHPGGRLLFLPDKTLLLSVGDGYDYLHDAQDLSSHLGKVLRIDRNADAPTDNPFVGREDALPEIWTYGHRNIQGLALDRETGAVWAHEHGPRGGDEINLLSGGANYGWPATTNGIDYNGEIISGRAHAEGIESPLIVWAPSIAPSGLAVYRGETFPEWEGRFLIGALAARAVVHAQRDNDGRSIAEVDRILTDMGARIRDVRVGPDGGVYILTDEPEGRLLRLSQP